MTVSFYYKRLYLAAKSCIKYVFITGRNIGLDVIFILGKCTRNIIQFRPRLMAHSKPYLHAFKVYFEGHNLVFRRKGLNFPSLFIFQNAMRKFNKEAKNFSPHTSHKARCHTQRKRRAQKRNASLL